MELEEGILSTIDVPRHVVPSQTEERITRCFEESVVVERDQWCASNNALVRIVDLAQELALVR